MSSKYKVRIAADVDVMATTDLSAERLAMSTLQRTLEYMIENEITTMKVGKPEHGGFEIDVVSVCEGQY